MEEQLFTPLDETRTKRLRFKRSEVTFLPGYNHGRGVHKKGDVIIGNTRYTVYGAACDLPNCKCDAYIVPHKLVTTSDGRVVKVVVK